MKQLENIDENDNGDNSKKDILEIELSQKKNIKSQNDREKTPFDYLKQQNNNNINNIPITKNEEDYLKLKINTSLISNIKTRKVININGCEIFKIESFCCCNNRDKVIGNALEFIDKCSEFGNIIKLHSEVDILKKVLLNKDQQEAFVLPSLNLRFNSNLDKIGDNEDTNEEKESFTDKLNIAYISLNNLDLKRKENRILAENIVSSIM